MACDPKVGHFQMVQPIGRPESVTESGEHDQHRNEKRKVDRHTQRFQPFSNYPPVVYWRDSVE